MPPEADAPRAGSAEDWLRHAHSDLALARAPLPTGALLEALCFHAQQAAEKALKAVLVRRGVSAPRTHSIGYLLDLVASDLPMPDEVRAAATLTDYAVAARYPGEFEPVDEAEYAAAVKAAETVVSWAERVVLGTG